jgi:hypothetical protein
MSVDTVLIFNKIKKECSQRPWKKGDPFLDIPLDPAVPKALKGTFQETLHIQQLQSGKSMYHRLQRNETTNKYEIINPEGQIVPKHKTAHIYSFVVLENEQGALELRLGLGNHYFTSGRADSVKAAGDIHLWKGDITKITNQSGGYHLENNEDIFNSARAAIEAVNVLPIEKFVAFNKPETPVLFSSRMTKSPSPHPYTVTTPRAHEFAP